VAADDRSGIPAASWLDRKDSDTEKVNAPMRPKADIVDRTFEISMILKGLEASSRCLAASCCWS
jgi:hypothetical protein